MQASCILGKDHLHAAGFLYFEVHYSQDTFPEVNITHSTKPDSKEYVPPNSIKMENYVNNKDAHK